MRFSVVIPTHDRREILRATLEALEAQTLAHASFEVIVVDDASSDGTDVLLAQWKGRMRLRHLRNAHAGASAARNAGAAVARHAYLVFIDDDLVLPPDWLERCRNALNAGGTTCLAGRVECGLPDVRASRFADLMNGLFEEAGTRPEGGVTFQASTNLVVRRETFRELGGFDERFFVGGEDREFFLRLAASGNAVQRVTHLRAFHYHPYTVPSLLARLFAYGRASFLLRRTAQNTNRKQESSFRTFWSVAGKLATHSPITEAPWRLLLFFCCQLSALIGFATAAVEGIESIGPPNRASLDGSAAGLSSNLLGTVVSSSLGFVSIVLIGRALTVSDYGVFIALFSLHALLTLSAGSGLAVGVTRLAGEAPTEGRRAALLRGGFVLQAIALAGIAFISLLLLRFTGRSSVFSGQAVAALLIALPGTVLFEYFAVAHAIALRFLHLSWIRIAVSTVRCGAVAALVVLHDVDPVAFFAAFFLPNWIGCALALPLYRRSSEQFASTSHKDLTAITSYGGWQTLAAGATAATMHAGPLLLLAAVSARESGIYGLGLSLSFIYSVVAQSVFTYFLAVGARVRPGPQLKAFVRRMTRLVASLVLVCGASLPFAGPLVSLMYGPGKSESAAILWLIGVASVLTLAFTSVTVLHHVLLRPQNVAAASVIQLAVFLGLAVVFVPYGAVGAGVGFLASRCVSLALLVMLLRRDLRRQRIDPSLVLVI